MNQITMNVDYETILLFDIPPNSCDEAALGEWMAFEFGECS